MKRLFRCKSANVTNPVKSDRLIGCCLLLFTIFLFAQTVHYSFSSVQASNPSESRAGVDSNTGPPPVESAHPKETVPQTAQTLIRRFEYKHSLRAPRLVQRDGTIPFWSFAGDSLPSDERIRLAPSMRSRRGIIWNKRPLIESEYFELNLKFKVTGQGRIGADGMALWYTTQPITLGPVFGSNDFWNGMGLLLDSFDNDGQRNNPSISLMLNDATRSYDHQTDGASQVLASCHKDFRNRPYPIALKLTYLNNVISVQVSDGLSPDPRYEPCIRVENVFLPKNGYFGASAATGGLADDHDLIEFSTFSLFTDPQQLERTRQMLSEEERRRYDAEFEKRQREYEEERKKYKEAHPDKAKDEEDDQQLAAKVHEDSSVRELRLINENQAAVHTVLRQMEVRLQEIQQAQRQALLSIQQQQQIQVPAGAGPGQQQPSALAVGSPSFSTGEKQELMQSVRDIGAAVRDTRNYASEVFTRTYNMEQRMINARPVGGDVGGGVAAGPGGGPTGDQLLTIRNYLDTIENEVRALRSAMTAQQHQQPHRQQLPPGPSIPVTDCPSCLSYTMFLGVLAAQTTVILLMVYLRSKSEKAKFY